MRWVMTKVWNPVGSGIMDDAEIKHVMRHLFEGRVTSSTSSTRGCRGSPGWTG
ncbi:hypothetical protein [Tessaracoccus coleopterorum]|uniref:hypothetical protein n=1 Tax=Tessaracoccus coleopterorum TaxID=2714950 RepID=UPI0018D3C42C|nr:hypothetical protein [Tessaracoccus coleopterorum]